MEGNPLQLLGLIRQRNLAVLLPEELRVAQPGRQHLAVAIDNRRAAIRRRNVGGADKRVCEFWGKLTRAIIADKILLIGPRGQLDDFGRNLKKACVKPSEQRHRPFGQPGVLHHQAFILDQHQPGGFCRSLGSGADQVLAFGVVHNHMACAQLGLIVRRAADGDLTGAMEPVAARGAA